MILTLIFVIFLPTVLAGDICWVDAEVTSKYCEDGCCVLTSWGNTGCCDTSYNYAWAIAVSVIGFVTLLIFTVLLVLWCLKKKHRPRRITGPSDLTQAYTTRTTVAYFMNPQYQYGQGPSYISRGQAINPPPYSNSGYSQPITQPGSSRPTAPTQQADRLQQKRPPDQPEGIQAPPPPAFALPSNHNIV